jgi:imidazolonepropionase
MRGPKEPRRGTHLNELGIITDGALLIRDGVIEEVGPSRRVENLGAARGALEISAAGRVVMPGFVDSHTHLFFPPPCGARDAVPDNPSAVRTLLADTAQRLAKRGRGYLETMARHGTTTVEAKTGCGPNESAETKVLRVLAALDRAPLDIIPTFLFRLPASQQGPALDTSAAEWVFTELMPKIRRRRLARFADLDWNCDPAFRGVYIRFLAIARGLGFACKIHALHDPLAEAAALAVENGALSIDHLDDAGEAHAALLARYPTVATLLPCATFRNGPHARARVLLDAGVAVALATNFNPCHDPSPNMQTVISLACLAMGMTAAEAISAATINGAYALGCADRVGLLGHGKLADVLLLNASDYRELGRQFGANLVYMTLKRGECIYHEGAVARDGGGR